MIGKVLKRLRNADNDLKDVMRGSAIAFGIRIVAAGSGFVMNLVVARQLGAAEAGLFFLAYSILFLAAAIGRLGLDNTFVRLIAAYKTSHAWRAIKSLYKLGLGWSLAATLVLSLLLSLLAEPIASNLFKEQAFTPVFRVMVWAIPLIALFTLHAQALQGVHLVPKSLIVRNVAWTLIFIVLIAVNQPASAADAALLFLIASVITLVLGHYWWRGAVEPGNSGTAIVPSEVLRSCMPLLAVIALQQIMRWFPQIMLGTWSSSADVAIFSAVQQTSMLVSFVLISVTSITAPRYAALYKLGAKDKLQSLAINTARLVAVLSIIPFAIMISFPAAILSLFGPDFIGGANALQVLAFGYFINAATGSVAFLLAMTGHERLLRNNVMVSTIVGVFLGFSLIPLHGVMGAAIASACAVATSNLLSLWQVKRILGFWAISWRIRRCNGKH